MTIKEIKLPSNPYSQLLVHNAAFTFLGKRRDWYEVRIFFPMLKLDSEATVVIEMLMRSRAQEKDWNSREIRKEALWVSLVWFDSTFSFAVCGFVALVLWSLDNAL